MSEAEIKQQINLYNYWEHFKAAKDLALILKPEHRKRKELEETIQALQSKLK